MTNEEIIKELSGKTVLEIKENQGNDFDAKKSDDRVITTDKTLIAVCC